jgi:stage V sporulation protein B
MSKKHTIIKGTVILTLTGFASRFIGFFYRIFLSHTIGAEGMGIYQLIFPVYSICFSLTAASIQTAISRFVASYMASEKRKEAKGIYRTGLFLSLGLSFFVTLLLYQYSDYLASYVILEPRCAPLLRIISCSVPLGAIHSVICGYYYGLKKTSVPAFSQLIEQLIRVGSVYYFYTLCLKNNSSMTPSLAVWGIIIGELFSAAFCILSMKRALFKTSGFHYAPNEYLTYLKKIITISVPLTMNRLLINILQSVEAIMIPNQLKVFGLNNSTALSVYGVLTGMALPLILFPSALTNSVSVMLLPAIAEAQTNNDHRLIGKTTGNTMKYSLLLGLLCTSVFLLYGNKIGLVLFANSLTGNFITTLAWICPFLYLTTTLGSILNGLGHTTITFIHNTIGLIVRILFVAFGIPRFGIIAYLWGLLASELFITFLHIIALKRYTSLNFDCVDWILKPSISIIIASFFGISLFHKLDAILSAVPVIAVILSCAVLSIVYLILLSITGVFHISSLKTLKNSKKDRRS